MSAVVTAAALAALLLLPGVSAPVEAATRTWTGQGANNLWTTPGNWSALPVAGDSLVFPAGALQAGNINNFPAGTTFGSITVQGTYSLQGTTAVTLTGGITFDAAGAAALLVFFPVTLASPAGFVVTVGESEDMRLSGVVSGAVGLTKTGPGILRLTGTQSNDYTGVTTVNQGLLIVNKTSPAVAVPAGIIVGDGFFVGDDLVQLGSDEQILGNILVNGTGWLDLLNHQQTATALTVHGGRITTGNGVLRLAATTIVATGFDATIEGRLSLEGAPRTIDVAMNGALDIKAAIEDGGASAGLTKTGPGAVRLSGANTYTGQTIVESGAITVGHAQALGPPGAATLVRGTSRLTLEVDLSGEPLAFDTNSTSVALSCGSAGTFVLGSPITLMTNTRTFAVGCTLVMASPIGGPGGLAIDSVGGAVRLDAVNSYEGPTFVEPEGLLLLSAPGVLPPTSGLNVSANGTIDLQGHSQTVRALLNFGDVRLGSGTLTIATLLVAAPYNFQGVITGSGGIVKKGGVELNLAGANVYTGPTLLEEGPLAVTGSIVSPMTIAGGTLRGHGTTAQVTGVEGIIEATYIGDPTTLTTGSLTLSPGMQLRVLGEGSGASGTYSRLAVAGGVDLGGATLTLAIEQAFLAALTGELLILDNDGTDAIAGTFANQPEGSLIHYNGRALRVSYVGGSGNDVTLAIAPSSYYFSEGATGAFFDTDILLANPNAAAAPVSIVFLLENGTSVTQEQTLPPSSRTTIRVDDIAGLDATAFSTVVTSIDALPIVVERTMRWDATGYGAHTEKATAAAGRDWFFAEGSQGFFSTYLLLTNTNNASSEATVTYLREGASAVARTYTLAPRSRTTIDLGQDPDLVGSSFGIRVRLQRDGAAERAMYFGAAPFWNGGHESAGAMAPSTEWFLAEGATGDFFETFVLVANPGESAADVTLTFLTDAGTPVTKTTTVPANGRITVNVEHEDAALANAAVATHVTASAPVIVERAQYWPFTPDQWHEAHNSFGVTAAGTNWGLAEGRVGGVDACQTYILLANPGTMEAQVTLTFLRESGDPIQKTVTVPPTSRFNVSVGPDTLVPELTNERFGAHITSDRPIVVERAMYWDANGQLWAAGTNATATRLP